MDNTKIDRDDYLDAVSEGVRSAIIEILGYDARDNFLRAVEGGITEAMLTVLASKSVCDSSHDELLNAIADGTQRAIENVKENQNDQQARLPLSPQS